MCNKQFIGLLGPQDHSDRFLIELFQNHGLKEWISLKIMLLWLWKVIMSLFNHEK